MSCGTSGPADESVARPHAIIGVHQQLLAVRNDVLDFGAVVAADDDDSLAALLLGDEFHFAVDLGDDGRVFRLAGLEELGNAGQTTDDVLRAGRFTRVLGQDRAGRDLLAFLHFDRGPFGQVVEVENLAGGVFEDDLRMQVALVLDDGPPQVARRLAFGADRPAFDAVVEADLAADFGQNGHRVRVPLAEDAADFDFFVLGDQQRGPVGNGVVFELAFLRVEDDDLAVSGEDDVLAFLVDDAADAGESHAARAARADFVLVRRRSRAAPPMWNVRMVSWVPGSPMLWAAMMPAASPPRPGCPSRGPCRSTAGTCQELASQVMGLRT